jgi:hypothetical protein
MADIPEGLVLRRNRDLEGRMWHIWIRRALIAVPFCAALVLALFNVFGQRPETHHATSPRASLELYAPTRLRGGLIWQARFTIRATQDVKDAVLQLGSGWLESMTVNTIEPSPVSEGSTDGKLTLDLGHIPEGKKYVLFMQFQTNPTNVGRRTRTVALYDGKTRLLGLDQTLTVFP